VLVAAAAQNAIVENHCCHRYFETSSRGAIKEFAREQLLSFDSDVTDRGLSFIVRFHCGSDGAGHADLCAG
jgi:hypothetical protein